MRRLVVLAAVLMLPGQSPAMPLDGSRPLGERPLTSQETVCVPPGLPTFSTWRGGAAMALVIEDETHRPVVAVTRDYTARGQALTTFWVGRILVSVDPAPHDPAELGWHDGGAVTPDTALLAEPKQACQWFKPAPRGRDQT